jgi:outer membrane protein assembly factor BamB
VVVAALLAAAGWAVAAQTDWPRFRGPDGLGVSADAELPLRWSRTENVRWSVEIPGEGSSSPIVVGSRVLVTAARQRGVHRVVHCLDRTTGRTLWTRELRDDNAERSSSVTGHAACTPCSDGKRVVAFFGNAGAVCFDLDGKQLWHVKPGDFDVELGIASSPVIVGDRVVLVCDHDGDRFTSFDSFLIALDLKAGKTAWKTERPGMYRSWSTPAVVRVGERSELVVAAQDRLCAYDPVGGKPLWSAAVTAGWTAPSPVFGQGLVFAVSGRNGPIAAVRPGGVGDVTATHTVWKHETGGPSIPSPVLVDGRLYVLDDAAALRCLDAGTGKLLYRERLSHKFVASAVAGAGRLYCIDENGTTFVIKLGPTFEKLAENPLGEYTVASPAISGGEIFLRTERRLWCIKRP